MSYQIRQEGKFKFIEQGEGEPLLMLHASTTWDGRPGKCPIPRQAGIRQYCRLFSHRNGNKVQYQSDPQFFFRNILPIYFNRLPGWCQYNICRCISLSSGCKRTAFHCISIAGPLLWNGCGHRGNRQAERIQRPERPVYHCRSGAGHRPDFLSLSICQTQRLIQAPSV